MEKSLRKISIECTQTQSLTKARSEEGEQKKLSVFNWDHLLFDETLSLNTVHLNARR